MYQMKISFMEKNKARNKSDECRISGERTIFNRGFKEDHIEMLTLESRTKGDEKVKHINRRRN